MKLPKVHPFNLGSNYFASSRRRALTWASLLGSGLIANLASGAPTKTPHGAGDDGTKPTIDAREDIRTKLQVATDSSAVTDVIMRERLARETHDWAEDAACFHSDAIVEVSWFKGSGAEFIEAGKNNPERATHAALASEAGYLADLGASVDGKPPASTNRPYVLPVREIMPKATDVGAGRIADMDEHGIDMQVLSYSNPRQLAPANQAVDLARAANDS